MLIVRMKKGGRLCIMRLFRSQGIAELLIAKGADVNTKNNTDRTPLHCAVQHNQTEIAELFITEGADVSAKTQEGFSPLHRSASLVMQKSLNCLLPKEQMLTPIMLTDGLLYIVQLILVKLKFLSFSSQKVRK